MNQEFKSPLAQTIHSTPPERRTQTPEIFFGTEQELPQFNEYQIEPSQIIRKNGHVLASPPNIKEKANESLDSLINGHGKEFREGGYERSGSSLRNFSKLEERVRSKNKGTRGSFGNMGSLESKRFMKTYEKEYEKVSLENIPNFHTLQNNGNKNLNFPMPERHGANDYQFKFEQNYPISNRKVTPESKIQIQTTLQKPKFGFKKETNLEETANSKNDENDLISFEDSELSGNKSLKNGSLKSSKSLSNFGDVLKMEQNVNLRVVENGNLHGYLISGVNKKSEKIAKKIHEVQKNTEIFDNRIREKDREIEIVRKKIEKEEKQLHSYQSKITQAYDNVHENTDSLLLSSRNYEMSNKIMEQRVVEKSKVHCNFEGIPRKVIKQILYGKCMILESDLLQIGFDNSKSAGIFELYFTVKENIEEMTVTLENLKKNGFCIEDGDETLMKVNSVPLGKKIKLKGRILYSHTLRDRMTLILLKVEMKINKNSIFQEKIILPFTLYQNFMEFRQTKKEIQTVSSKAVQKYSYSNNSFPIVTQWENSCDELIKSPKGYLQTLFKNGKWVEDNVFNVEMAFQNGATKSANILINCRNFAIEMADIENMDSILMIGSMLCRAK